MTHPGLENRSRKSPKTPESAEFCGLEPAQDAMFATCSTSRDGTLVGTPQVHLCPNIEDHTDSPEGYLHWHIWAGRMAKTHKQRKCQGCGKYVIWEPKRPSPSPLSEGAE